MIGLDHDCEQTRADASAQVRVGVWIDGSAFAYIPTHEARSFDRPPERRGARADVPEKGAVPGHVRHGSRRPPHPEPRSGRRGRPEPQGRRGRADRLSPSGTVRASYGARTFREMTTPRVASRSRASISVQPRSSSTCPIEAAETVSRGWPPIASVPPAARKIAWPASEATISSSGPVSSNGAAPSGRRRSPYAWTDQSPRGRTVDVGAGIGIVPPEPDPHARDLPRHGIRRCRGRTDRSRRSSHLDASSGCLLKCTPRGGVRCYRASASERFDGATNSPWTRSRTRSSASHRFSTGIVPCEGAIPGEIVPAAETIGPVHGKGRRMLRTPFATARFEADGSFDMIHPAPVPSVPNIPKTLRPLRDLGVAISWTGTEPVALLANRLWKFHSAGSGSILPSELLAKQETAKPS